MPKQELASRIELLARELPVAIETRTMTTLGPYFAEDALLTLNVPMEPIRGRSFLTLSFDYNPLRTRPVVNNVIVDENKVIVISNVNSGASLRKLALAPRIDTFHLDALGQINRVQSYIGSRSAGYVRGVQ